MTNGNRPVYRYPPRSHAYNCPCPRCVQCRSQKTVGDGLIAFDMGCLAVILAFAGIGALAGLLSRVTAETWLTVGAVAGVLAVTALAFWAVSRRAVRPPKGRLQVEATAPPSVKPASPGPPPRPRKAAPASPSLPFSPVSLTCQHLGAVRVEDPADPERKQTLHVWCPDCDPDGKALLPANWTRPCCGTRPGRLPGEGHFYNCPQAARG